MRMNPMAAYTQLLGTSMGTLSRWLRPIEERQYHDNGNPKCSIAAGAVFSIRSY